MLDNRYDQISTRARIGGITYKRRKNHFFREIAAGTEMTLSFNPQWTEHFKLTLLGEGGVIS